MSYNPRLGLFSDTIHNRPTAAATGSWTVAVSSGAAAITDVANGVRFAATSGAPAFMQAYKTAPATPYRIRMLITQHAPQSIPFIGFRKTSGEFQFMFIDTSGRVNVQNNSNLTTFAGTALSAQGAMYNVRPGWMGIRDDGTTVYFETSGDGVSWYTVYSVAKASGYLGSSGYNQCCWGGCTAYDMTVLDYFETS